MANISPQNFNEKVSLIYEYNKHSPLLFRAASIELEKNNPESCIKILLEGLNKFPENPVGYILLGKAYARIGEFEKAKENLEYAGKIIKSEKTTEFYLAELERIKKNFTSLGPSRSEVFLDLKNENETEIHEFPGEINENEKSQVKKSIDDELERIAAEISNVKLSQSDEQVPNGESVIKKNSDEQLIVSETMANILISQGQFGEAIKVYYKLIEKNPDRESYLREKINDIEKMSTS